MGDTEDTLSSEITEIFMPKEYWILDTQVKKCFLCQNPFDFFTRKHHCRMCGNVFDFKCSNNFVSPPYFVFEDEKKIRLCNECYLKSQSYLQEGKVLLKRGLSLSLSLSANQLKEMEVGLQTCLTRKAYELSNEALEFLLTENNLCSEWYIVLKGIVKECMEVVQTNIFYDDTININKIIKIKKIPYKDRSLTQFIRGVVIRKNVINGKPLNNNNNINHPTVLMLQGNLDRISDESTVMDASSINREKILFDNVINKILELDPHIVIVEGRVGRVAQELLNQSGKTVVGRIKKNQFARIADVTHAVPVNDLTRMNNVSARNLGSCNSFSISNYQNKVCYGEYQKTVTEQEWEQFDPALMFFEGCKSEKDATIMISGSDTGQLSLVKACLKRLLPILRTILLERGIINQEINMFQTQDRIWRALSNGTGRVNIGSEDDFREKLTVASYYTEKIKEVTSTTCMLNESTTATTGYILNYLTERMSIVKILQYPKVTFTKFTLVPLEYTGFPDLSNLNSAAKAKLEEEVNISNCWHRHNVCQLEKEPQLIESYFQGEEDMTLGVYLLERAARAFDKCTLCNCNYYSHIHFFLVSDVYIKVELDPRDSTKFQHKNTKHVKSSQKGENTSTIKQASEGFLEFVGAILPLSNKDSYHEAPSPGVKNSLTMYSPNSDWPEAIMMYIECSKCSNRLSEIVRLKRNLIEYSFTRFLECLVNNAEENIDYIMNQSFGNYDLKEGNMVHGDTKFLHLTKDVPRRPNVRPCCPYSPKNRVFMIDDFAIKFKVGFSNPFSFSFVDYRDSKALAFVKAAEQNLIATKQVKLNELQKNYLGLLIDSMKRVLYYLMDRSNMDLTLETIGLEESLVANNNMQVKDPYNMLLLSLIPLYRKILSLRQEIDQELLKKASHHFEIDKWRREFYEKIKKITETLERSKDEYLNLIQEIWGKPKKDGLKAEDQNGNSQSPTTLSIPNDLDEVNRKFGFNDDTDVMRIVKGKFSGQNNSDAIEDGDNERQDLEKELQLIEKLVKGTFSYYEGTDNNEPLKFDTMPVFEDQVLSVIAYALNSPQYMKEIFKEGLLEYKQAADQMNGDSQYSTSIHLTDSNSTFTNLSDAKPFVYKIPSFELEVKYPIHLLTTFPNKRGSPISPVRKRKGVNLDIIEDIVGLIEIGGRSLKEGVYCEKLTTTKHQVICYYPVQFEALRATNGIVLKDYLSSLSSSQSWEDNTGGKTGAGFIKTNDQRFVFKELEKKEFTMLLGFIQNYFRYISEASARQQMSLLTKIYGTYEISDEKRTRYFIAMENLFFAMGQNLKVYDLKGSEVNRYVIKKAGEKRTLFDTNYKIDRNGEPLPIKAEYYNFISNAIKNDTEFLAMQKKIDYSLLLMYDEKKGILRMGIIDYVRSYDFEKQLEYVGKRIIKGALPTIIGPEDYKERFKRAMKKYFVPVHKV